jgi:hypothetical protein
MNNFLSILTVIFGIVTINGLAVAQPTPTPEPTPLPTTEPSPISTPEPNPTPEPSPTPQSTPVTEPSPTSEPSPEQPPDFVPKAPIPGESCEARIVLNGDRILYRTSYIGDENLKVDGLPVEVDMFKNESLVAHAIARYTNNLTFAGQTGTGTPLSFQLSSDKSEIKLTHAGRTIDGKCGDALF